MIVVVSGTRHATVEHGPHISSALWDAWFVAGFTELRHGACRGADELAAGWGLERVREGKPLEIVPVYAEWGNHANAAGPMRNAKMLDGADLLIAFPLSGPRSLSKGTWDAITKACERGCRTMIYPLAATSADAGGEGEE